MRDLTAVKDALKNHQIELPSWAFGNSGTRFKVFGQPGVPRTPYEKASDAAQVHKYTGVAPEHGGAHPVGQDRRLRGPRRARQEQRHPHRHRQLQRLPGRRLQARQRVQPRPAGPRARPSPTCWTASTSWTPPARGTSSCGSPTAPTTPARTTSPRGRTGSPRRWPPSTGGSGPVSGCCWSTSCSSRRSTPPTCRTGAPACCTARRSAPGPWSSSTPATTRRA